MLFGVVHHLNEQNEVPQKVEWKLLVVDPSLAQLVCSKVPKKSPKVLAQNNHQKVPRLSNNQVVFVKTSTICKKFCPTDIYMKIAHTNLEIDLKRLLSSCQNMGKLKSAVVLKF